MPDGSTHPPNEMMSHFLIGKWYSVLRFVFCLWYICFEYFCGILWHGVLWIIPIHYLLLFANKFRIFLVSCDLKSSSNAYHKILIFSCECCSKQILLLWNYQFWLVLVSVYVTMPIICFLLVFPLEHCGKLRQLLLLLLILQHTVVFFIQLISHHS